MHKLATNQTDLQPFVFNVGLDWRGNLSSLHLHPFSVEHFFIQQAQDNPRSNKNTLDITVQTVKQLQKQSNQWENKRVNGRNIYQIVQLQTKTPNDFIHILKSDSVKQIMCLQTKKSNFLK